MKKLLFIVAMFFGQYALAQKVNTTVTILDVTNYVKKMFPNHDNNMTGNIIHYRYDATRNPILKIIEEKDFILVMQLRYDGNGNITERSTSSWLLDSSKKHWESTVLSTDAPKFKELYKEAANLILEISSPKINSQKMKFPYLKNKGLFLFLYIYSILIPICNNY